jgi:ABC-2 type transport system ATP-binding protein
MREVIRTVDLTKHYRKVAALDGLNLAIPEGSVFGLVGPNGAGKTTTIKTLMNILKPDGGHAEVLGVDSRRIGPAELARIGYVSENQEMPNWMTVEYLLSYLKPFYATWDDARAAELVKQFDLPGGRKLVYLSRGMRMKAALASSLAYRPQLLVLDEPFSGLDPVVRDDLVRGVLELAGEERWSVLISSHDLDEVERLVDAVGFIDAGRLVLMEPLADLHGRFRRIEVTTTEPALAAPPVLPQWTGLQTSGRVVRFVETRYRASESERQIVAAFPGASIEAHPMTLREIFVAVARQQREARR